MFPTISGNVRTPFGTVHNFKTNKIQTWMSNPNPPLTLQPKYSVELESSMALFVEIEAWH